MEIRVIVKDSADPEKAYRHVQIQAEGPFEERAAAVKLIKRMNREIKGDRQVFVRVAPDTDSEYDMDARRGKFFYAERFYLGPDPGPTVMIRDNIEKHRPARFKL